MIECTKCNEIKEDFEFRKYKRYQSHVCISCENEYKRNWRRRKYPDKYKLYVRENLISSGLNKCVACGETKSIEEFGKTKYVKTGYYNTCKVCRSLFDKNTKLKSQYKINIDDYLNMLKLQNSKCPICKVELTMIAHVDHDHSTGKVRELLCNSCNGALGLFKDDPKILQNALNYLEKHSSSKIPLNEENLEADNFVPNTLVTEEEGLTTSSDS